MFLKLYNGLADNKFWGRVFHYSGCVEGIVI